MMRTIDDWPMGLCVDLALLEAVSVEKLRLNFSRDRDELDSYSFCVLETDAGKFALRMDDSQAAYGYKLIGMEGKGSGEEQINNFLRISGLMADVIQWQRPAELDGC